MNNCKNCGAKYHVVECDYCGTPSGYSKGTLIPVTGLDPDTPISSVLAQKYWNQQNTALCQNTVFSGKDAMMQYLDRLGGGDHGNCI